MKTLPKEYVQLGYKIGALGMSMLRSKFDYSDMKSRVDHSYSYVLQHTDPVQKCAERARKVSQTYFIKNDFLLHQLTFHT